MPVHFKGTTEYQNKFKAGRVSRSRSASPHRPSPLAGLRSDELGIVREPQFQSRKKVSHQRVPQVSSSLIWDTDPHPARTPSPCPPQRPSSAPAPAPAPGLEPAPASKRPSPAPAPACAPGPAPASQRTPPAPGPAPAPASPEHVKTPEAPRGPRPTGLQSHPTPPPCALIGQAQCRPPMATKEGQSGAVNGVHHVLKRKAGLRSSGRRAGLHSSEYSRQFLWGTRPARSPLLAAEQVLKPSHKTVQLARPRPVPLETEYQRNFKGSPQPRGPRYRRTLENGEATLFQPENVPPEEPTKSKRKKRREEKDRKYSPQQEVAAMMNRSPPEEVRSLSPQKPVPSHGALRKVRSEYDSNFRSPLCYRYQGGVWVKAASAGEEGGNWDPGDMWYQEVRELRSRAEAYRKRAWGTHFSRLHLNQILSEQTHLWEPSTPSSTSLSPIIEALDLARVGSCSSAGPSVPLSPVSSRKSSTGGAEAPGPAGPAGPPGLPGPPALPVQRKLAWGEEQEEEREKREEEHDEEEGRIATPQMKVRPRQRTHHDKTTPTTGGALLVSPPRQRRGVSGSDPRSPYRQLADRTPQKHPPQAGSPPGAPSIAGVATVDPLPLREEACSEQSPPQSPPQDPPASRPSKKAATSQQPPQPGPPLANRIQGTLRNPEFQHNGNLGLRLSEVMLRRSGAAEEDDRMSEISWRSTNSCAMATAVLERAQKRREDFWGKR